MSSSLTPGAGQDSADRKPLHQRTAAVLHAVMARSAIPLGHVLVIGDFHLTMDLHEAGLKVDFIPDRNFFKPHPSGVNPRDALHGMKLAGIGVIVGLTSVYMAVGIFQGRRESEWLEERRAASESPDSLEAYRLQRLADMDKLQKWQKTNSGWDAVIADTDDPWFHPSWWSRACEYRDEDFQDIAAVSQMLRPGGVLLFRQIPEPSGEDIPELWRDDWPEFLASAFGEHGDLSLVGATWFSAQKLAPWGAHVDAGRQRNPSGRRSSRIPSGMGT